MIPLSITVESPVIDIDAFDINKLNVRSITTKTPEGKIKVSKIILEYDYGIGENPQVDVLRMNLGRIDTKMQAYK